MFCAENILYNLISLIKERGLDEDEIKKVNEFMQHDLAKYYIMQYPKSEDKEFNQTFASKISEIDNLNSNNHDLVYRSKAKDPQIKFEFRKDGNYNSDIMRFLNYVIDLANQDSGEKDSDGETLSLGDRF